MVYHTAQFPVAWREGDWNNVCRPSALLGFLQEAGVEAGEKAGLGRETMLARYNAVWLLARTWVRLERPLLRGAVLSVQTWHRGQTGARLYRDFALTEGGEPIGRAVTMWVPFNRASGRPMRLSDMEELVGTDGGALCYDEPLPALHLSGEGLEPVGRRRVGYSDLDVNRHMNNTRYVDVGCDALPLTDWETGWAQELQIGYLGQGMPGEEMELALRSEANCRALRGTVAGSPRFEMMLRLKEI